MKRTLMCAVVLAAGCSLFLAPTPARCEAQSVEHTVRAGDNLHLISGYYFGNPREWKRIWRSNRAKLAGPSRLVPGTILRIEGSSGGQWPGSYADFLSRVRGK